MAKYIVLAEKNTLAEAIAKAFGSYRKLKDHYKAENLSIGKAEIYYTFGHILQAVVQKTLEKANCNGLPCFPSYLALTPSKGRGSLFKAIADAIKKGDYDAVIHAGDPDREGELLIREVLNYLKASKPVYRIWFNSLTKDELYRALNNLKPLSEYDKLYSSARARQLADFWLGINGSNALQKKLGSGSHSVGRVQTPVLKLIYDRDIEIKTFKPETYYTLFIYLNKNDTKFKAEWFNPERKEKANWLTKELAEKYKIIVSKEKYATVQGIKKELKKQLPPKLPKLSDVQVEAGRKLKIKASEVLSVIQGMYERGILSYPRTDSNYLAASDKSVVLKSLDKLGRPDLKDKIPGRIFNDKDVAEAGHHAIIPLDRLTNPKNKLEEQIYKIILNRFLAQFYPLYEYELTTVVFDCGGLSFKATGRAVINIGWMELYKGEKLENEKNSEAGQNLPVLSQGEKVNKTGEEIKQNTTKPPSVYTSANLIKKMSQLNLGTQATRANYEPLLQKRGYITTGRQLNVTESGKKILEAGIKDLRFADPEFTSKQEQYLDDIARGKRDYKSAEKLFLERVKEVTQETVNQILSLNVDKSDIETAKKKNKTIGQCSCGGDIVETPKTYRCSKCGKYVFKTIAGKKITPKQAVKLIQGEKVLIKGMKSKKGKKFSAYANLCEDGERWSTNLEFT